MATRNNKNSKVQKTLDSADAFILTILASLCIPIIFIIINVSLINYIAAEVREPTISLEQKQSTIDDVTYAKNFNYSTELSRVKAISNQLNVYDIDWIEEANEFSLTDKQFQIARNSVIALNTGLNPCDQTSIFFKIKGRQIVQANSFKDLAVLSYFCEHPDAFVGVNYD